MIRFSYFLKNCRFIHLSKRLNSNFNEKVENISVTYKLPEILKKIEDNSTERLNHISKNLENKIDGKIDGLNGKIDGLNGKIDGLIGKIDGKIDGFNGKIDGLIGKIDGLNKKIDGKIDGLNGKIDGLAHKIAVYAGLIGTGIAIVAKMMYDLSVKKDNKK